MLAAVKKGVKKIQAVAYNGARTVFIFKVVRRSKLYVYPK